MVANVGSLYMGVLHSAAQVYIGVGRDGLSVTLHYYYIASHFVVVYFGHGEDFEVEQAVVGKLKGAGIGRYHLEFDRGLPATSTIVGQHNIESIIEHSLRHM
jgi:hypothetical protein